MFVDFDEELVKLVYDNSQTRIKIDKMSIYNINKLDKYNMEIQLKDGCYIIYININNYRIHHISCFSYDFYCASLELRFYHDKVDVNNNWTRTNKTLIFDQNKTNINEATIVAYIFSKL